MVILEPLLELVSELEQLVGKDRLWGISALLMTALVVDLIRANKKKKAELPLSGMRPRYAARALAKHVDRAVKDPAIRLDVLKAHKMSIMSVGGTKASITISKLP